MNASGSVDPLLRDPMRIGVVEVFGPTLQGEGTSQGLPVSFLRLGYCNLTCTWCDTPYTWDWSKFDPSVEIEVRTIEDVAAQLRGIGTKRIVVSGGEPLIQQKSLTLLLRLMVPDGFEFEIETNGTLVPDSELVELVTQFNVSPKLANSAVRVTKRNRPEAIDALNKTGKASFKFVATCPDDLDEIALIADEHGLAHVLVMPEGTTSEAVIGNMRLIAPEVVKRGWRLSTRLHVLLWEDTRAV